MSKHIVDASKVQSRIKSAHGRVKAKWVDESSKEVVRVDKGENHVFLDAFRQYGAEQFIVNNQATFPQVFLTDGQLVTSDRFPYLDGNIMLWGGRNMVASGNHQGDNVPTPLNHLEGTSVFGQSTANGRGLLYRYEIEFSSGQLNNLPEMPRKIGITPQYRPRSRDVWDMATSINTSCFRPLIARAIADAAPTNTWATTPPIINTNHLFKDNMRYSIHQSAVGQAAITTVQIYDMLRNEARMVDVSHVFSTANITSASQQRYLGVAYDRDDRFYLAVEGGTGANQRRVFEFANDNFQDIINTYDATHVFPDNNANRVFAVYDNMAYSFRHATEPTGALYVMDYVGNSRTEIAPPPCPFNSGQGGWTTRTMAITIIDDNVFCFQRQHGHNSVTGTNIRHNPIYSISRGEWIATTGQMHNPNNEVGMCILPEFTNSPIIGMRNNSSGFGAAHTAFVTWPALCVYTIPDEDRIKVDNAAWIIEYEIEIIF